MTEYIALLRGINVGATRKLPMAELRQALAEAGHAAVRTYIQSGNVLLSSDEKPEALETQLEALIAARFGLTVPIMVRSAVAWSATLAANPLQAESDARPHIVHLGVAKRPPARDAVMALAERAHDGERIIAAGDALWFDFGTGIGTSRLTPTLIDRLVGAPVTLRNWRTAQALERLSAV